MASAEELQDGSVYRDFSEGLTKSVEFIQTHLSMVFLVGDLAFKVKKAVRLGPPFADQSTLSERERLCRIELVKNREWNSSMYIGVYPIVREAGGSLRVLREEIKAGGTIDYALCMKRFDTSKRLDNFLDRSTPFDASLLSNFGAKLARLQSKARRFDVEGSFYNRTLRDVILSNIDQLIETCLAQRDLDVIRRIGAWLAARLDSCSSLLRTRADQGYVRELHGDLHSRNLYVGETGAVEMFDCLDFNDDLARIDPTNDLAFLFMDLYQRNRADLAWTFFDAWLEVSGDLDSIQLLRIFAVYRAVVRCKIAALQAQQQPSNATQHEADYKSYLDLALQLEETEGLSGVVVMMGRSGSGKSYWGSRLLKALGAAIRVKSDVERKRLFGGAEEQGLVCADDMDEDVESKLDASSPSKRSKIMYSEAASDATYARLIRAARAGILGKQLVILDASYLSKARRRALMTSLDALRAGLKPLFVQCEASEQVLIQRIQSRQAKGEDWSDANVDVMKNQVLEPFDADEDYLTFETDQSEEEKEANMTMIENAVRSRCGLALGKT